MRTAAAAHTSAPSDRREPGEVFGPAFSLFADVLLVSLLTSLCCLPVLTAPAAFAAASATLRETAAGGRTASARTYLGGVRARLGPRSLLLGLLLPAFVVAVRADLALADGDLPGRALVAPALVVLALGAGGAPAAGERGTRAPSRRVPPGSARRPTRTAASSCGRPRARRAHRLVDAPAAAAAPGRSLSPRSRVLRFTAKAAR
ncbi:hypothetical protein [Streptomyces sp. SPB074]|uniref:hypothetical protein n=1 Tax=Streptomyces sp. (strain SPB074) TaxID=465543 RepID=UPI001F3CEF00|nr:hypothetical protein [Streptomyces sp. SPB074]